MAKGAFDKLKEVHADVTPKQKIVPIKEKKREQEQSYTLWLDKQLLKALKLKAVEQDSNVKNLVEEAIRQYLK
jgi:predicted HicB family RNase H-like nuclease